MRNLFLLLVVLLQACSSAELKDSSVTQLLVESHRVSCQGLVLQQCYLVKEGDAIPNGEWTYFYESIVSFDYIPGYRYTIEVEKTKRNPQIQDVGSYQYTFLNLITKEAMD